MCLGTQLDDSSSYHPQYDEKTEIVNKCLDGYLHWFVFDKQTWWVKWLSMEEWCYNNSFHTSSRMPLFIKLYGYHPPPITSPLKGKFKVQDVEDNQEPLQDILYILKENLSYLKK